MDTRKLNQEERNALVFALQLRRDQLADSILEAAAERDIARVKQLISESDASELLLQMVNNTDRLLVVL